MSDIRDIQEDIEYSYENCIRRIRENNDCFGDYENYQKCFSILKDYDREKALRFLKKLICKYKLQMDELAYLCGGQYMMSAESYEKAENIRIICDIHYIGMHIPSYALLREGRTTEAEQLLKYCEDIQKKQLERRTYGYSVV